MMAVVNETEPPEQTPESGVGYSRVRIVEMAVEAQLADVIDDRIGARVGARSWAAADPYLKVRCIFLVPKARSWQQKIDR